MPDVAAGAQGPEHGLVVLGNQDAVEDALGGHDLVGAHDEQVLVDVEHAVLREDVEEGMLGEERRGEGHEIADGDVVGVGPPARELEAVGGLLAATVAALLLAEVVEARRVGVVLRVGAVADDEDLHILEQPAAAPEAVALVALDLVERLHDGLAAALELHVHERQAVDEDGHVVAVLVGALLRVLVHHLEAVVVDVALVDEADVLRGAVIAPQGDDVLALDAARLVLDAVALGGDVPTEEPAPFGVGELDAVKRFELGAEVGHHVLLGAGLEVLVALPYKLVDESRLKRRLGLVGR